MKIIFDHQIFYAQSYGGISRYFYELASGLTRRDDCSVSIVAPFHVNEYLRNGDRSFVKGPYSNQQFRGAGRIRHWGRNLLLPLQYSLNGDADIVHETYYSMDPFGRGQCRVLTVYDMIHELFSEEFKNDLVTSKAKKAAIARADHVICISESTRQDLIRLFDVDSRKTSVVHLGYSLLKYDSQIVPAKSPNGRPYILYVGGRGSYKNFSKLCLAFSSSRFLKENFDLVAFGGGCLSEDEISQLVKRGIYNNVHQINGDDALLASYYTGATLFVYPSLYEGFGIPPLEAMSFGCPVACSNTSSIPEVVSNAGAYFDPSDADSMREALEKLINDDSRKSQLIKFGYERLKSFSWDKCASETSAVYRNTLSIIKEKTH